MTQAISKRTSRCLNPSRDPWPGLTPDIQNMLAHAREFYLAARTEADLEHRRREDAERAMAEHSRVAARLFDSRGTYARVGRQLAQATEGRNLDAEAVRSLNRGLAARTECPPNIRTRAS